MQKKINPDYFNIKEYVGIYNKRHASFYEGWDLVKTRLQAEITNRAKYAKKEDYIDFLNLIISFMNQTQMITDEFRATIEGYENRISHRLFISDLFINELINENFELRDTLEQNGITSKETKLSILKHLRKIKDDSVNQ